MAPNSAEITVVPTVSAVASPREPAAFEIVATPVVAEAQVTASVMSWTVASVKMAMARNCCFVPLAIVGSAGVMVIETGWAVVTVSVVLPLIAPLVAEMDVVPKPTGVARPFEPSAFEIVATAVVPEVQVTLVERSCVVASLNVPVAKKRRFARRPIDGDVGVTAIETSVAGVEATVSVVVPLRPTTVAEMTVVPAARAVAWPFEPLAFEMVAVAGVAEAQVAVEVT